MEEVLYKRSYPSDEEIVHKVVGGDILLFEILIRRYNSLLYKIARTYGFGHHDAEDLMQETHVCIYQKLAGFRGNASYKTWITKIHLHNCYHKANYGYNKYEHPDDEVISKEPTRIAAECFSTEKKVVNRELSNVLEKSLENLPLTYRSVFVLREVEGFSVAETAEILSITTINVKVRLNRAKTLLQQQLEKFYSSAELYEFNLVYCDGMVRKVLEKILPGIEFEFEH